MSVSLQPELGSGPLNADLWVIGRDYGAEEARLRQPFQGQAGQVLNVTLKFAGLNRETVRIDNLVPRQPRANDWANHNPADIAWGQERLSALLRAHRPKLILALGGEVAAFLLADQLPEDGVQSYRGYLWDTAFGRVLTTVHPAGVLRDWTPWRALLNLDMRRAAAEAATGCPALDTREVQIVTRPSDLDGLREAQGLGAGWLAVDIENRADLTLACVGFAPNPRKAWVIPASEGWQLAAIRELVEGPAPKVLANGQYDRFFLRRFAGMELRDQQFDVQLAWHAIQPELAGKKLQTSAKRKSYSRTTVKSLKFLSSIYTRDPFWKKYGGDETEQAILCGRDVCVTFDIMEKQARQLEAS